MKYTFTSEKIWTKPSFKLKNINFHKGTTYMGYKLYNIGKYLEFDHLGNSNTK